MEGGGGDKGTVCVTGGTGYIASWLIMNLLQQGYTVRATVRLETENKKDLSYLTTLPGASKNLQIINADLNKPDTFSAAISGCPGVFHLAHPIDLGGLESDEVITKRALEGTLGILQTCVDSKTVKRVVYTSSAATVMFRGTDQGLTDERFWSDVEFYKEKKLMLSSYVISKTKTEMAVLEFADKHGLDVVSVIPSLVVGPFICPTLPSSVFMGMAMIFGKQEMYKALAKPNLVHVDDVANAHIFLFEHPNAKGRYICSSNEIGIHSLSEFLSAKYPEFPIPKADVLDKIEGFKTPSLSSKKLLDSGFKFKYGLDEMFDEAFLCCKEKGFL